MKEYVKLYSVLTFTGKLLEQMSKEAEIFSTFKIETIPAGRYFTQTLYVPEEERQFYEDWKDAATALLESAKGNAVLRMNIARRHGIKLQK